MDLLELKAQWKEEQAELKQRLILTDNIGWVLPPCNSAAPEVRELRINRQPVLYTISM